MLNSRSIAASAPSSAAANISTAPSSAAANISTAPSSAAANIYTAPSSAANISTAPSSAALTPTEEIIRAAKAALSRWHATATPEERAQATLEERIRVAEAAYSSWRATASPEKLTQARPGLSKVLTLFDASGEGLAPYAAEMEAIVAYIRWFESASPEERERSRLEGLALSAAPSNIRTSQAVPNNIAPSNIRTSQAVPNNIAPSNIGTSQAVPSNIARTNIGTSNIGASQAVPSNIAAARAQRAKQEAALAAIPLDMRYEGWYSRVASPADKEAVDAAISAAWTKAHLEQPGVSMTAAWAKVVAAPAQQEFYTRWFEAASTEAREKAVAAAVYIAGLHVGAAQQAQQAAWEARANAASVELNRLYQAASPEEQKLMTPGADAASAAAKSAVSKDAVEQDAAGLEARVAYVRWFQAASPSEREQSASGAQAAAAAKAAQDESVRRYEIWFNRVASPEQRQQSTSKIEAAAAEAADAAVAQGAPAHASASGDAWNETVKREKAAHYTRWFESASPEERLKMELALTPVKKTSVLGLTLAARLAAAAAMPSPVADLVPVATAQSSPTGLTPEAHQALERWFQFASNNQQVQAQWGAYDRWFASASPADWKHVEFGAKAAAEVRERARTAAKRRMGEANSTADRKAAAEAAYFHWQSAASSEDVTQAGPGVLAASVAAKEGVADLYHGASAEMEAEMEASYWEAMAEYVRWFKTASHEERQQSAEGAQAVEKLRRAGLQACGNRLCTSSIRNMAASSKKRVPPKIMSQINLTDAFKTTKIINVIISNINTMMTYFIGEFTTLRITVLTEDDVNSEVSSRLEPLTTQINTLSAKIDSLMNNYGEFGSAPPAKGGRRLKRRTMKKRK